MPPRLAPDEIHGLSGIRSLSSQAATRSARPETEIAGGVAASSKPRQVEPLPGQLGHSTVWRVGSTRSGAQSAGHHASVPASPAARPSPKGNGEAVMPPTITTTGAVPEVGAVGPPAQADIGQLVAFDGHGAALHHQTAGTRLGSGNGVLMGQVSVLKGSR